MDFFGGIALFAIIVYAAKHRPSRKTRGFSLAGVGRHRLAVAVCALAGQTIPELDVTLAENRDKEERDEVNNALTAIEKELAAASLSKHVEITLERFRAFRDDNKLTRQVLITQYDLETRAFALEKRLADFVSSGLRAVGLSEDDIKRYSGPSEVRVVALLMQWMSLGGHERIDADTQAIWWIMSEVWYPDKAFVPNAWTWPLVTFVLFLASAEDAQVLAGQVRSATALLIRRGQLTTAQASKVKRDLEEGLKQNRERTEQRGS